MTQNDLPTITLTDGRETIAPCCVLCGEPVTEKQYDVARDADLHDSCRDGDTGPFADAAEED